jgi:hypothetical protein
MTIFSLQDKINDMNARLHIAQFDTAAEATDTAGDDTAYGVIDLADQRPDEKIVMVPQGRGWVSIYYSPVTRDARPIPRK